MGNYSLITIQFYAELMDNDWASLHKSGMVSFFKTASIYKRWAKKEDDKQDMWPPIQKMKRILVTSNATTTYRDYVNRYSYINRYIPLPKAKGN